MKRITLLLIVGFTGISNSFFGQAITVTLGTSQPVPPDFFGFNGANVIRPGQPVYNDSALTNKFAQLFPSVSRYPAGQIANWWDWRIGCIKQTIPDGIPLRGSLEGLKYKNNDLAAFKVLVDRNGVVPIFDINLMTSNKYYESAGLYYASGLNLPVKYIEFGTEFYNKNNAYGLVFPTAESYAAVSNDWAAFLRTLPGGVNYKIAVVGAADKIPTEPLYSRQNTWTKKVCDNISNNVNAVTIHNYIGASLDDLELPSLSNLRQVMESPFSDFDKLKHQLDLIRTYNKDVWITEFNLFDRDHCLQGTWASGLLAAAMQMTYNEDSIIKLTTVHTMVGNALWSMMFNDSSGFDINNFYDPGTNCLSNEPNTNVYEFSAAGNAFSLIGKALQSATTRKKMLFSNVPLLPAGHDALYGWRFNGTLLSSAIILNLDSLDHNITINTNDWNVSGGTYTQMYPGPGGPLALIKGNAVTNPGINEIKTSGSLAATQSLLLKAYSITLIEKKKNVVEIKLIANSICSGTNTTLSARGGTSFTWTGQNLTNITPDGSVKQFTATISATTVFTFTVTDASSATASATITVYPKPALATTVNQSNVCKGYPVNLSATLTGGNTNNFSSFIWIEDDGKEIADCMNPQIQVNPVGTTTYYVYATDGHCWANVDSQKITINAIANAGTDQFVCTDSLPKTLTAKNILPGFNYSWYRNNKLLSNTTSVNVSPVKKTTYKLVMVNAADTACKDTAFVTLDPIVCCGSADTTALTFGTYITIKDFAIKIQAYCNATGQGTAGANSLSDLHKEIIFNGILAVDRSFTFYNCDKIKFGERSKVIFMDNSLNLTFKKCSLKAASCSGKMWRGLKANLFGVTLTIDSCYISGADTAVYSTDDATLYVQYSKLENNYIGINLFNYSDDGLGSIKGDSFVYNTLLPPHSGQRPLCGVRIENIQSIDVGDSTGPPNCFAGLDYGILGYGAEFSAYNNSFTNFYPNDTIHSNEGSAIYAFNPNGSGNVLDTAQLWPIYTVTIGDSSGGKKGNTMTNCKFGINTDNIQLRASGNTITNVERAVRNVNGVFNVMDVSYNNINKSKAAVEFITPKGAQISIHNNTITTDTAYNASQVLAGIRVSDDPMHKSLITIHGNVVNTYGTHGIYISTSDYGKYTDNKVYLKNSNTSFQVYGYRYEDCDSVDFSCNLVKGNNNISNKTGLRFINSDFLMLRCCTIDKVDIGMNFIGDCDNMQLRHNWIYYSNIGISVGAYGLTGGKIGPQPAFGSSRPYGNKFFGSGIDGVTGHGIFAVAATRSVNSFLAGGANQSTRFYVYEDSIHVPYPNLLVGTGSALTPFYTNKKTIACNTSCDNPNPGVPNGYDDIHKTTNETLNDDNETIPAEQLDLNLTELIDADANDPLQYSRMKRLYQLSKSFDSNSNTENVSLFLKKISETNIERFSEVKDLVNHLTQFEKNNDRRKEIEQAQKINAAIAPKNIMEKNEKQLNIIVLEKMLAPNGYSKNYIKQLRALAYKCPYTCGDAVFMARSLYSEFDDFFNYDDLKLCAVDRQQTYLSAKAQPSITVNVHPLPANDFIEIEFKENSDISDYHLMIINAIGEIVLTKKINNNFRPHNIDISILPIGVYIVQIETSNTSQLNSKLIIVR